MILNPVIESLLDRRTIRAFQADQISEEELSDILVAARFAPSALGKQERHMTVIQNGQLLYEISEIVKKGLEAAGRTSLRENPPFYGAPTVIVFSAPKDSPYGRENAAVAAMTLIIAAHAYGLGTCYIASALVGLQDPAVLPKLQLPEGYVPTGCVAIGYSAEQPPAPLPRRSDDVNLIL